MQCPLSKSCISFKRMRVVACGRDLCNEYTCKLGGECRTLIYQTHNNGMSNYPYKFEQKKEGEYAGDD